MQTAFLVIYTLLYLIGLIFLFPFEYFKRPPNIRKRWLLEKMGFFAKSSSYSNTDSKPKIWIHAVSVGEVLAISSFVKALSKDYEIIISTITDTGQRVAFERFKNYPVKIIYLPFDTPCAIRRTINFFKPKALILVETELWPNLIFFSSKKFPVFIVNGRLSEKSYKGYKKLKIFIKPLLRKIHSIYVQEETYKDRFINLGAEKERIYTTGNMKFDIEIKEITFEWENSIPKPIILAGSTHEPEEEIITDIFIKLNINGTLIITPRHPERFERVENVIKNKITLSQREIYFSKLSEIKKSLNMNPSTMILLVDRMGILSSLYRICDIAIIGGSFIPHGGQNPLEPAYWKKPFICGLHMNNFPFVEEFIKEQACIMTKKELLDKQIIELINNNSLRNSMGLKAYEIFKKKSGATERTLNHLKAIL